MIDRRSVVGVFLALPFSNSVFAQACLGTAPQTEGPFFKTDTPLRTSFIEKGSKSRFLLEGSVLTKGCKPIPNALLEFWHADEAGEYDNRGQRYRGHQHADAQGRYRLETIVPALYPGRARHFHVKVQAPGRRVLTTQLYFAGDPGNARDSLFDLSLVIRSTTPGAGNFDFVVEA